MAVRMGLKIFIFLFWLVVPVAYGQIYAARFEDHQAGDNVSTACEIHDFPTSRSNSSDLNLTVSYVSKVFTVPKRLISFIKNSDGHSEFAVHSECPRFSIHQRELGVQLNLTNISLNDVGLFVCVFKIADNGQKTVELMKYIHLTVREKLARDECPSWEPLVILGIVLKIITILLVITVTVLGYRMMNQAVDVIITAIFRARELDL